MKKPFALLIALSSLLLISGCQDGHQTKNADAEYRENIFHAMSYQMKKLAPMIKGEQPYNQTSAQLHASFLNALSIMPWQAFSANSEAGSDAKSEVWSERGRFDELATQLQKTTNDLRLASNDQAAFKTAFGQVADTCKTCHETYRKD